MQEGVVREEPKFIARSDSHRIIYDEVPGV